MTATVPQTLADRFACIIDALRRAVAARGADRRVPAGPLSAGPLLILLWTRLGRMAVRFAALAAGVGAGTSASPAHGSARRRAATRAAAPSPRLPGGFGWLLRAAPEAAAYGSQLRHLLADPEFSALVSAAPAMGRVLRPLCRMLGIELSSPTSASRAPRGGAGAARRGAAKPRLPSAGGKLGKHRVPPGWRSILRA